MSRVIDVAMRTSALQVAECVRSAFALEFLQPGHYLYLCAAVLHNAVVLPNRLEQFGALFPDVETQGVRLDAALMALRERGVSVRLIYPAGLDIDDLLPAITGTEIARPGRLPLRHKGLLTEKINLRGALHFGTGGIMLGDDTVELVADPVELQRSTLEMDAYWEELA